MTYPFSAIVGQRQLVTALLIDAVDPRIGGVLVRGHKGTAKSTAVRGLAALLPDIDVVAGCAYACPPDAPADLCTVCEQPGRTATRVRTPLVELPIGASEDRLLGSIDLERALADGVRSFEPGLLARAHRGVLYVDEVNLLDDHLVDVLLDAAAMGVNHVEREGVSVRHPARFQLIGTMNPEEGELRPQLLDRFGLTVEVVAPHDPTQRAEVVRRRLAYESDPDAFATRFAGDEGQLADRIVAARDRLPEVVLPESWLTRIVEVCAALEVDGLRADIVTARAAVALAAWRGAGSVAREDVRTACLLALPHRRRRGPFDDPGIDEDELDRLLGDDDPTPPDGSDGPDDGVPDGGPDDGADDGADDGGAEGTPDRSSTPGEPQPADGSAVGPSDPGTPADADPHPAAPGDAAEDDGSAADAAREPQPSEGQGAAPDGRVEQAAAAGRPALLTVPSTEMGADGRRSPGPSRRGASVGARPLRSGERPHGQEVALAATLRAAAPEQRRRQREGSGLVLRRQDIRQHVRRGRQGSLIVLCVDASGSMGARQRMSAVKGAVRALLFDAYQRRDLVAMVTFRADGAQLVLPPTAGVELADRQLAALPTGGRTPLAAGLLRAGEVITTHARRDPARRPLLVAVTDGRATGSEDALADARRAAERLTTRAVPAVVVDTEQGFVRLGLAGELATTLRAPCLQLDELSSGSLSRTIRVATGRAA
ncbi:MAG: magnesium chelatase subunit D family protein [Nitriliruptor sp.]